MKGRSVKDGDQVFPVIGDTPTGPSMKGRPVKDGDLSATSDLTSGVVPSMKGRPVKDGDLHQRRPTAHHLPGPQ